VKSVKNSISNAGSAIAGFFGFGGGQQLDGMRANGGPVRAGGSYIVGERGPEVFTPNRSGTILPNSGGGVAVYITGNTIVGDSDPTIDRLMNAAVARLKRLGYVV
jgi:phage-related minor tail protein